MLKLSQAMTGWSPAAQGDGPLSAIEAAWSEIVGANVAQNSYPARITGETLLVITRSSAWSHQLSFLAEQIVGLIATRTPDSGVTRLRFRVGAQPEGRKRGPAPASRPRERSAAPRPPAKSAAEALARFREDVERKQQSQRSGGWTRCRGCAALVGPQSRGLCAACAAAAENERTASIARLVAEAPWLGYRGTAELVDGLHKREYERVRNRLLTGWWRTLAQARADRRLSPDGRERSIASSYVLLKSGLSPEEIMPATVRSVLGDELVELLYGTAKG